MSRFFDVMRDRSSWLRMRREGDEGKVVYPELFFDLVFVFSIVQLSHTLAEHYSPAGIGKAIILILAVWWVWNFTTWVTNWLDPDRTPVRGLLFVLMFCGLVLSASIPDAFGEKSLLFAVTYVLMQVGRSLFAVYALRGHSPVHYLNFLRITCWLSCSAVFWLAGAFAGGEAQLFLWIAAIVIEYLSPALGFQVPGLGRSKVDDWDVLGAHMAERCALFVIICLGEALLVTGRVFSEMELSALTLSMFFAAFASTVTMWWIYFRFGQARAAQSIENANRPGVLARTVFTYAHLPIVSGIILCAVAEEFMLAHPYGATDVKMASAILAGPAIFLAGNIWIKASVAPRLPVSHLVGIGLLAAMVPVSLMVQPYQLYFAAVIILIIVALWEYLALKVIP